jgi:hypothetical protein
MPTNTLAMQTQQQLDKVLSAADHFIWPTTNIIDCQSKTFFVYKPYPKQIKRNQIKQWAKLQSHSLSPFTNGDHYQYLSARGLHLWFSQDIFSGVPETAMQVSLNDGDSIVKGALHVYQQTWSDGTLINCITLSSNTDKTTIPLEIDQRNPWALPRKIDNQLKKPTTWLGLSAFIGLCATVWFVAAYVTLNVQRHNAEQNITALQESLGEKLAEQAKLQNQQQNLLTLQNWHREFGFLPESFAAIVEKISLQGDWKANSVSWQNRLLTLELTAQNIDIAKLVAELESVPRLAQINIRPHLAENTWVIEASVK